MRTKVRHRARPTFSRTHPVHITLRVDAAVGPLREPRRVRLLRDAMSRARPDFRVVHYSVQNTHLHLLVEADGRQSLSRGVRALCIRIARALNHLLGRRGVVFGERYHAHALKSPREVRHALAYVLLNHRRHRAQATGDPGPALVDPYSSGHRFLGWADQSAAPESARELAQTWLLRVGWLKAGRICLEEVPGRRGLKPPTS